MKFISTADRRSSLITLITLITLLLLATLILLVANRPAHAQGSITASNNILKQVDQNSASPGVSPVLRIERTKHSKRPQSPIELGVPPIDGRGNNAVDTEMNATSTSLARAMPAKYVDGVTAMIDYNYPSPRVISNIVNAQGQSILNRLNASDFLWQWGQFLDHDLDLTDGVDPPEQVNILIPVGDPFFDPSATGTVQMEFNRSIYQVTTGTASDNPRQQLNELTGWVDGSQVYGSDSERAAALRTLDGTGRLKMSDGNLLPFNTDGLPNAGGNRASLFLAGDVRANEQLGLTAMHTLFVREHNRLAADIASREPQLTDEQIYQRARRIVIAELQAITYNEFVPALLGPQSLAPYRGYKPNVDARIMNEFSTAAFRLGHTLVSKTLLRLDASGREIAAGHLPVRDAFFAPQRLIQEDGIEPILRGLASQRCQELDIYIVDDLRNFLFGAPGQGGFDLASLNIQRGRDHGLPHYNDAREAMGLARKRDFSELSSDTTVQARLASAYPSVDHIDFWIGGLAEDHLPGAQVGELFFSVLKKQFENLRDGDRFWYQRTLSPDELRTVTNSRLADIIVRNTTIGRELQRDVFRVIDVAQVRGGTHTDPRGRWKH